ncbi:hypothetical protein [Niabella aurantiaca]|uniref:hypothetical protein n=1 Tax=Niabella aurantiaca TaxID=379900 RepID=UPI00035D1F3A|nr:hypothetical protein [Niabella aurantiaca]
MLTEEQIQALDQFCEQNGVRYYDLRLEIVDHLAAGIEEKMAAKPDLPFNEALKAVYKDFGMPGFSKIIAERREVITRNHKKAYWELVRSYMQLPNMLLSACIMIIVATPALMIQETDRVTYTLCIMLFSVLVHFAQRRYLRHRFKPGRPLIFLYGLNWEPYFTLFFLFNAYRIILFVLNKKIEAVALTAPLFLTIGGVYLVFELCDFSVNKKLYQTAAKNYPLAFKK